MLTGPQTLTIAIHYLYDWATSKYFRQNSLFIRAAFLDLVSLCGIAIIRMPGCQSTMDTWTELTTTISIGPEYPLNLTNATGSALLQRSLSQVFFIDRSILRPDSLETLISREYQTITDALMYLETLDPDTCFAALDTLQTIVQTKQPQGPLTQISLILLQVFRFVHKAHNVEVLSKAQSILAGGLSNPLVSKSVLSLVREEDLLAMIAKMEQQCLEGAPFVAQSATHLLGFLLDSLFRKLDHPARRRTILPNIARYVKLLRMMITDTNPFDARFAAVQSISALHHLWTLRPTSKPEGELLLGLAFVLYDLLADDDDEIRNTAALATTTLLQTYTRQREQIKPAVPVLTAHRLARFLVRHFRTTPALCKEALRRLTDTPPRSRLSSTTFAATFAVASKEETALFSTEKQNLFYDPTLDTVVWSRVLCSCSISPTGIPPHLRAGLKDWVVEGLTVLGSTAKTESDVALGWSAKADVFSLGMRVICAAGVVMKWEGTSAAGTHVRRALVDFLEAGREGEVHGLWIEKGAKVLEDSVLDLVNDVRRRLMGVHSVLGV
jgi:hypothetical protein